MAKRFRFRPPPPPDKDEQMARAIRLLTEERSVAANGKIELLLQTTPLERFPELVEHPLLRTYGAFERLGRIFAQTVHSDPARAHAMAELGISIAENLSTVLYPPATLGQARGYAWKDLGVGLRIQGRNQESLEALETAARALQIPSLRHDLAIIHFSTAVTLQELERYAESRALLAECKEVFLFFSDETRAIRCGFAEGILVQRLKSFREAREIYLLILSSARTPDTETLAALHRAIGICSIELGDFREAESNLLRATSLSEQLGQRLEAVKAQAAIGMLLLRRGEADKAIVHLRPIRREFLRHGLTEEAGICGLEIVQGMLELGRASTAQTLARTIIGEFTKAKLNQRAISALGYLTESIAAMRATTAMVAQVREYIVSLRTSPERDFTITG